MIKLQLAEDSMESLESMLNESKSIKYKVKFKISKSLSDIADINCLPFELGGAYKKNGKTITVEKNVCLSGRNAMRDLYRTAVNFLAEYPPPNVGDKYVGTFRDLKTNFDKV